MTKLLITSGCSFSTMVIDNHTWPSHMEKHLRSWNYKHFGMGSQGNGLISRSIVYGVSQALKKYQPEDVLVGVMWSSPGRHDYFVENTGYLSFSKDKKNYDGWLENPTGFIPREKKNWVILNAGWKTPEAKLYYENFFDPIGCIIYTLEHILRCQWLLKQSKINYFFTCYTDYVLHKNIFTNVKIKEHDQIKYLFDMIDFNNFLPVNSITSWLIENKIEPLLDESDKHPTREQHKAFVDQVIMPHLITKNLI